MSAELIQDAIVTQLKNDTGVAAVFGVNVSKGMGRNFNFRNDKKGIRIYQMLENINYDTAPRVKSKVTYPFLVIILFYEPDEVQGETLKTQYANTIRKALEKDITFSGTCFYSRTGDARFYFHPLEEGAYYIAMPLTAQKRETVG